MLHGWCPEKPLGEQDRITTEPLHVATMASGSKSQSLTFTWWDQEGWLRIVLDVAGGCGIPSLPTGCRAGYVVSLVPLVDGVWAGTEEVEACL